MQREETERKRCALTNIRIRVDGASKIYSCLSIPNCTRNHVNIYILLFFCRKFPLDGQERSTASLIQRLTGELNYFFNVLGSNCGLVSVVRCSHHYI